MRRDLVLHFYGGAAIFISVQAVIYVFFAYHSYTIPAITVVAIGVGKEVYDRVSGKGTPEFLDIMFTCLGGASGFALSHFIVSLF